MAITFEGYERRIDKINKCLAEYGIKSLEECKEIREKLDMKLKRL